MNEFIMHLEELPRTEYQEELLNKLKDYMQGFNNAFKESMLDKIGNIIDTEVSRSYIAGFSDGAKFKECK